MTPYAEGTFRSVGPASGARDVFDVPGHLAGITLGEAGVAAFAERVTASIRAADARRQTMPVR